jgi:hypothetical protein
MDTRPSNFNWSATEAVSLFHKEANKANDLQKQTCPHARNPEAMVSYCEDRYQPVHDDNRKTHYSQEAL